MHFDQLESDERAKTLEWRCLPGPGRGDLDIIATRNALQLFAVFHRPKKLRQVLAKQVFAKRPAVPFILGDNGQ